MAKNLTLMVNGKKLVITPLTSGVIGETLPINSEVHAPGQGSFEISNPTLSANTISESDDLSCQVTVKGNNINQIFSELMIQLGSYLVGPVLCYFLHSAKNREIKGVVHPHWESENVVDFVLDASMRLLCCGEGFTLASMTPKRYGVEAEAQIWILQGIYQRGGGEPFRARFEFDHKGNLVHKTGFCPKSIEDVVSPFELLIEEGDTFEPFVTLIDDKGDVGIGTVNPIMLGGGNLPHWERIGVIAGTYQVGVVVEDFDGKVDRKYSKLTIKPSSKK